MKSIRIASALGVCLLAGCFDAHTGEGDARIADGGSRDGAARDSGARDTGLRDAGPFDAPHWDGPEDCREFGGNRRCDERCPRPCPGGVSCAEFYGVCASEWGASCANGGGCAFDEVCAQPEGGFEGGTCLGTTACLEAERADLPLSCRYSDWTRALTGPPLDACPSSSIAPGLCGGTCGDVDCGESDLSSLPFGHSEPNACWGVSDTRGFGVCIVATFICSRTSRLEAFCEMVTGVPCACAVALPRPDDETRVTGVMATLEQCRAYHAAYPDGVECRGEDWSLLE